MFGWLAPASLICRRAPRAVVSRRSGRITPHALIDGLSALGSVLYLHAAPHDTPPDSLPDGLLVVHHAGLPLLDAHWLTAISVVTADGPREWCECVDRFGHVRARWHLLPDTDYLAWDAMTSCCEADGDPIAILPLQARHAAAVKFRLRECAGLQMLELRASTMLSPLGGHIAARIARDESVRFDA